MTQLSGIFRTHGQKGQSIGPNLDGSNKEMADLQSQQFHYIIEVNFKLSLDDGIQQVIESTPLPFVPTPPTAEELFCQRFMFVEEESEGKLS